MHGMLAPRARHAASHRVKRLPLLATKEYSRFVVGSTSHGEVAVTRTVGDKNEHEEGKQSASTHSALEAAIEGEGTASPPEMYHLRFAQTTTPGHDEASVLV